MGSESKMWKRGKLGKLTFWQGVEKGRNSNKHMKNMHGA